jgi:hypothetical protein
MTHGQDTLDKRKKPTAFVGRGGHDLLSASTGKPTKAAWTLSSDAMP